MPHRAFHRTARRLIGCSRGASAVEFALAAPFLILGLVMMVDIGIGVTARMELDRSVRAGVQAAMTLDRDGEAVANFVRIAAQDPDLEVTVEPLCRCGNASSRCDRFCQPNEPPSFFYEIRAERTHSGVLLKGRTIRSETRVQLR